MFKKIKPIILICFTLTLFSGCAQLRDLIGVDPPSYASTQAENDELRNERVESAVRKHKIIVGMEMGDVRNVWGDPAEVESAGDSPGTNQRWIYYSGLSSRWSLRSSRIVYFEGGRVVGWETASSD